MSFARGGLLQRDLSDAALRSPPPPHFDRDDIESAKQDGFQEGYVAAHAEAAASRAASEALTLAAVAGAMLEARQAVTDVAECTALAMARAVSAAMRATVPALMRRSAGLEIATLVEQILPGLAREPSIAVEVAPDLVAGLIGKLSGLPDMQRGGIIVRGVDGLPYGDARITWGAGDARREPDAVWQQVIDAFAQEHLIDAIAEGIPSHAE